MRTSRKARRIAKRLLRVCTTDDVLDEVRVRRAVHGLARSRRRNRLPILRQLQRLVAWDRARHSALVESAVALLPDLRAKVNEDLNRLYGTGLSTTWVENPALIGGMRVKVGSDVYDGSVRARLSALEGSFE
jgi:F-type H+-transporting ATPase subunit delta